MRVLSRAPCRSLASGVEKLWYYEGDAIVHREELVLPLGVMQVIVELDTPRAIACGVQRRARLIDTKSQRRCVGAVLRPAMGMLLGTPAARFTDAVVDLRDVWGNNDLAHRLAELESPEHVLDGLEYALVSRLADERRVAFPTAIVVNALERGLPIRTIASEIGTSASTFGRRFEELVGTTPRRYARIRRLQRAVRTFARGDVSWAETAHDAGFFDQAHLVRDFRELVGVKPSDYAPRSPREPNHVPVRASR